MKKLMVVAVAAFAGAAGAADLVVQAGAEETIAASAAYENVSIGEGAVLTVSGSVPVLTVSKSLTGSGKIVLNQGRLLLSCDVPDTMTLEIIGNGATYQNENRVQSGSGTPSLGARLVGSGRVRIGYGGGSGIGGFSLSGDNTAFEGTLVINGNSTSRSSFTSASAVGEKMRVIVDGTMTGNGNFEFEYAQDGSTAVKFGALTMDKHAAKYETTDKGIVTTNSTYVFRANRDNTLTMEVGALNQKDIISMPLGNAGKSETGHLRLRKVGTGELEVWKILHRHGTLIDDGTLLVTSDGALANGSANITFGSTADVPGGTLKYGDDQWDDFGNVVAATPVVTDYSAQIKNSQKAVAIDTNGKDITFATVLDASNVGGVVKKGAGTLTLAGESVYSGLTDVQGGTLKVGFRSATGSIPEANQSFSQSGSGKLEVSYLNEATSRLSVDFSKIPAQATLSYDATLVTTLPRFATVEDFQGFSGVLNYMGTGDTTVDYGAHGLVKDNVSDVGSKLIDFGVLGNPESPTQIYTVVASNGTRVHFGDLRLPNPNAQIFCRRRAEMYIGARGGLSELNGSIVTSEGLLTMFKEGTGTMKLGEAFTVSKYNSYLPVLKVQSGTFDNAADLSKFNLTIAAGVTLKGDFSTADAAKLTDYTVELPEKADLVKGEVYDLVKVPAGAAAPTVDLTALNAGETKGKWKVSKNAAGVYQLSWKPNGLAIVIF